jgi:hypothetical protein
MRVVQVIPKSIVVLTEFTVPDLRLLKAGLDATELNLDLSNDYQASVEEYMTKKLYKQVSDILAELDGEDVGSDS